MSSLPPSDVNVPATPSLSGEPSMYLEVRMILEFGLVEWLTIDSKAKGYLVKESKHTKDEDDLSDRVRRLMRPVPHALTVITSYQPGKDPADEPEPRGLLVSSFNTVTLFPRPYVTFNIKLPSSTWDAIKASGHFTASGIDSSATATAFTLGQADSGDRAIKGGWAKDWISKDGRLLDHRVAYWWMQCRCSATQSLLVQDHLIAVGEVLEAGEYRGGRTRIMQEPLLYANGGYCRLRRPGQAVTRWKSEGKITIQSSRS